MFSATKSIRKIGVYDRMDQGTSFENLPLARCIPELCTEGSRFQNENKNRYSNVLPVDTTRVKISTGSDPTSDDYINANYVDLGGKTNPKLIACQAPIKDGRRNTESDFWLMVYQQRAPLILMVTPLIEGSSIKSSSYWPFPDETRRFGSRAEDQLFVKCLSVIKEESWEISRLLVGRTPEDPTPLEVIHIYYYGWYDFGTPKISDMRRILDTTLEIWCEISPTFEVPIVCHCSAGLGRTGTIAAILRHLFSGETALEAVKNIRKFRHGLVQNSSQYQFILDFVGEK